MFIVTLIIEFTVSIVLRQEDPTKIPDDIRAANVSMMFLASAIPISLAAFAAAAALKPETRGRAIRMSLIWTAIFIGLNILTGLGNDTMEIIFLGVGFYAAAVLMFVGPIAYARFRKLI
jgi:predicted Co/Zn/Cd cation transporter (cation efflux family)